MPRVLVVAYYFPPIGGIGSIRLARFASQLPDHGWEPTVLAPRDTPHAPDPLLPFPEERVVRSRSIELSRIGRRALAAPSGPAGAAASDGRSLRGAARDLAHRYAFFPDPQIGWYPGAVVAGLGALRRERFDVVYSSSYPMTAHLVASTLSRRSGLPWVAEHRDPWADRIYHDHPYRRAAEALERSVARRATKVLMPTPTWAEHYGERWGVEVGVLANGHDGVMPERRRPERPTLTHVGSYYPGEHDLTTLWEALARLRAEGKDPPRVRFVGTLPDQLREEIDRFGLGDLLESTGFVSHEAAMRELMSATMLIASGIAGDRAAQRGWVPAKLFEYLASGLPVLYLADEATDAGQLVAGYEGCHVVAPGDVEGTLAAVRAGLGEGDRTRDVGEHSREARAARLAEVLEAARRIPPGQSP